MGILVIIIVIAAAVLMFGIFVERARLRPFWSRAGTKLKPSFRVVTILFAIPVGAMAGFFAVGSLSVAVLNIWSWGGTLSNDDLTSSMLGLLGLLLGSTLLPWGISRLTEPGRDQS